jgi:RecB family exonuclease
MTRPAVLSPSAIDRYRVCPRQFLLVDLERRRQRETPSESLVIANAVHEALELFFGLEPAERDPALLELALRHVWPKHRRGIVFLSREHEAAVGRKALDLVQRYPAAFETSVAQVARETRVSLQVSPGVVVAGRVDRVELVGDPDVTDMASSSSEGVAGGTIEVIDYKTGSRVPDEQELLWDPAVQVYVLGAARRFGRAVSAVRMQYLVRGEEVRIDVDDSIVEVLDRRLRSIVAELRSDAEFEPRVDAHCTWCPVAEHCDARSQVRPEDLQPVIGMPF